MSTRHKLLLRLQHVITRRNLLGFEHTLRVVCLEDEVLVLDPEPCIACVCVCVCVCICACVSAGVSGC